jgi:uncharacterized membrane protein
VLGVFIGIYAYCLMVLRTIRGGDGTEFVPSVAVFGGLVLALIGIGVLVYFIHHLADSIQASAIVARVAASTLATVDRLFPERLGAAADSEVEAPPEGAVWTAVAARRSGYIGNVSNPGLLALARRLGCVLRMDAGIGDFIVEGQPLASLSGEREVDETTARALDKHYVVAMQRTIDQDAAFGIQQLVDVGRKALSPAVNDPTTALLCIDRLAEILVRLAGRHTESRHRTDAGEVRVIARAPGFESLAELAYSGLTDDARDQPVVLGRLLWSVEQVAGAANPSRRPALEPVLRRFNEQLQRAALLPSDAQQLGARVSQLFELVAGARSLP